VVSYKKRSTRRRRAVTPALKDARRDAILGAAMALFCKEPLESITMNALAAAAGIAKGTLYLYFRTKEEIFLALLARENERWLAALGEALRSGASPDAALDWIVDALAAHRELVHLAALLHAVLERNVPIETARQFKLAIEEGVGAMAPGIARALQLADDREARRFLRWLQACVVGVHQLTAPTPAVRAAILADPRLADFAIDFKDELRALLGALLRGLHQKEAVR
jgi:TetR/AcrR family transcriptional regulator